MRVSVKGARCKEKAENRFGGCKRFPFDAKRYKEEKRVRVRRGSVSTKLSACVCQEGEIEREKREQFWRL